ncbi:MAG TPA: YkgJ family cysteine cluster protein [Armatimonadota bacterium]|nr:YkgJ family cysteine cluster protein [Armatimonadota bacterium]
MINWDDVCDGCTTCSMRCTANIKISEDEYTRIVDELRSLPRENVRRVLEQTKELPWSEEITYSACAFLDTTTRLCLIYPARPLVCRLFGRVKHLPCPEEKVPADIDASRVIEAYASQPLRTFPEWMAFHGIFDYAELVGGWGEDRCFEV